MFLLDRLLIGGIRFVLDKVAQVADSETASPERLKEELLAAEMQLELGEIDEERFLEIEREVLARLREIRAAQREGAPDLRPTGVEVTFTADEEPGPR